MNRTYDLKVMSLASYHCSTPRYIVPMGGLDADFGLMNPKLEIFKFHFLA